MGPAETSLVLHTAEPDCVFCDSCYEHGEWFNRPIASDEHRTLVLPAVGALVPGYVLVLPVRHVTATCRIPASDRAAFAAFVADVAVRLTLVYKVDVTLFEHAACDAPSAARASCINHAHLHAVPGNYNLSSMVGGTDIRSYASLEDFLADERHDPYLMLQDPGGPVVSFVDQPLSQYFRRVIARQLGMDNCWDYALFPFWNNVKQTCDDFAGSVPPTTQATSC